MTKKYTIDRSKWLRGTAGMGLLLNSEGKMCCLGFICEQEGAEREELLARGYPSDLEYPPAFLIDGNTDSASCLRAAETNDIADLTDLQRETKLHTIAAQWGVELEFVGE